jgi:isoquinoline 1-oxidoreductase beta subunit
MATEQVSLTRREFLIGTAAAGAGFSLGLYLPFASGPAAAADIPPEVNAWVVIQPDDTVVIRIARSEMGQGTLTGLAQMVAEELECDWSKVTTEYPTPGQNLARDRVWGSFSTGGSQGIRGSEGYVRKGGAVAREMLIEAAAEGWVCPKPSAARPTASLRTGPAGAPRLMARSPRRRPSCFRRNTSPSRTRRTGS